MKTTVAHLVYRLDVGGLERFMVDTLNRTCSEFRHIVVCITNKGKLAEQLDPSIEVVELNKQPGLDLSIHKKVFQLIRRKKVDVLHTYNLPAFEYHLIAKLAGVAFSLHAEHGRYASDPQGQNPKHRLLRRLISPFVNHIICVSNDMEEWMVNFVGITAAKVSMIPNGIDTDRFLPLASQENSPSSDIQFLHVARLDPVKKQEVLIKAFAEVVKHYSGSRLNIVGDGPERNKLEQQIQNLKLGEHVILHGQQLDTLSYFHTNQVFVLSSIAEGTPMTVLEAMATGLPIVATEVGGMPSLVHQNENGCLVAPNDEQALASAMMSYLKEPELILQHGLASRKLVVSKYSHRISDALYCALYSLQNQYQKTSHSMKS